MNEDNGEAFSPPDDSVISKQFFSRASMNADYRLYFDPRSTQEARDVRAHSMARMCQELEICCVSEAFEDKDGRKGIWFGFPTLADKAAFVNAVEGDLKNADSYYRCYFTPNEIDAAAELIQLNLRLLQIDARVSIKNDFIEIDFANMHDRMTFQSVHDRFLIHETLSILREARGYRKNLEDARYQNVDTSHFRTPAHARHYEAA